MDKQVLPLRYVLETTLGLSNARNRAIRERRADWILFTDDDVILDKGWLRGFSNHAGDIPAPAQLADASIPGLCKNRTRGCAKHFQCWRADSAASTSAPRNTQCQRGTDLVGANFSIRIDPRLNILFNPLLGPIGKNPIGGDELGIRWI